MRPLVTFFLIASIGSSDGVQVRRAMPDLWYSFVGDVDAFNRKAHGCPKNGFVVVCEGSGTIDVREWEALRKKAARVFDLEVKK